MLCYSWVVIVKCFLVLDVLFDWYDVYCCELLWCVKLGEVVDLYWVWLFEVML